MKRLVSVIILAGAPIACGTQSPSAPETIALSSEAGAALASASSDAQRPAPTPVCVPGDRSHVRAIALRVVSRGPGFVALRAEIASATGDSDPTTARAVCLDPSFSVSPVARLDRGTPEQVTVFGAPGRYTVTARSTVSKLTRPIVTSAAIKIE
jgi:hypothetical protein